MSRSDVFVNRMRIMNQGSIERYSLISPIDILFRKFDELLNTLKQPDLISKREALYRFGREVAMFDAKDEHRTIGQELFIKLIEAFCQETEPNLYSDFIDKSFKTIFETGCCALYALITPVITAFITLSFDSV